MNLGSLMSVAQALRSKESFKMANPHLQENVDKMLHRGIFFSIFWLLGIGSLIAIKAAVKARRIIVQSDGEITGMGKVWWCLIVGGIGLSFWLFVFLKVIINQIVE